MFMVQSSWHSHCESSPGSFDECRLSAGWPPTLRPNQPIYTKYENINTIESTNSEMGTMWQNPIQRTVRTAHLSVLMTVHNFSIHNTTQNSSDNLSSYLQTTIIAQMMSVGGERGWRMKTKCINQMSNAIHLSVTIEAQITEVDWLYSWLSVIDGWLEDWCPHCSLNSPVMRGMEFGSHSPWSIPSWTFTLLPSLKR